MFFYYCKGLEIEVQSQFTSDMDWLEEFLTPSFRVTTQRLNYENSIESTWSISLESLESSPLEKAEFANLLKQSKSAQTVAAFSRESTFAELAFVGEIQFHSQDYQAYIDNEHSQLLLLNEKLQKIILISKNRDRYARYFLMKTLREVCHSYCASRGSLVIHAAAISFTNDNSGFLLCGPKRSGKTTEMLSGLKQPTAQFVANDRVVVYRAGNQSKEQSSATTFYCRGLPTIISVRAPTLDLFPEFRESVIAAGYDSSKTIEECTPGPVVKKSIAEMGYRPLSIKQLCQAAQTSAVAETTIKGIIFLSKNLDSKPQLANCSLEKAESLLSSSLISEETQLGRFTKFRQKQISVEMEKLLGSVPAFTFTRGESTNGLESSLWELVRTHFSQYT